MAARLPKKIVDTRGCLFTVVSTAEEMPKHFLGTIRHAHTQEVAIFGGGMKNFTPDMVAKLVPWVEGGFTEKFAGVAMSGGTANWDVSTGELQSDVVTAIPPVLAAHSPCIAIGTFPRVYNFALDRQHNHLLTGSTTVVDNRYHHTVCVQESASVPLSWSGDLTQRFAVLDLLSDWKKVFVMINGGGVSRDEAYMALAAGIPIILGKGTKRETDALIAAFEKHDSRRGA